MSDDPPIFFAPAASAPARKDRLQRLVEASNGALDDVSASTWAFQVILPADVSWALIAPGKCASTTTLAVLYRMQFGSDVTAHLTESSDINSDRVLHDLIRANVFRRLIDLNGRPAALDRALRIATLRNPTDRAVSAYTYLCRTDALGSDWLLPERLRLSAVTSFDWTRHAGTADGFERFLDYVAISQAKGGPWAVNSHWRRQVDMILPDFYKPDVLCRTENLAPAYAEIAERLGRPLPEGAVPNLNAQGTSRRDDLLTPQTRRSLAEVYAADYDTFGYDAP